MKIKTSFSYSGKLALKKIYVQKFEVKAKKVLRCVLSQTLNDRSTNS
jgi:hypothetical protein